MNRALANIICFLPLINILVDMFSSDEGFHLGNIRALILFLIIAYLFIKNSIKADHLNSTILFFLIYLLFLTLLSSNIKYAFINNYLKVSLSYLMFPLAYYTVNNYKYFEKVNISVLLMGVALIFNYAIAQIFKIGRSDYLEDSFYTGAVGAGTTSVLILPVVFLPLMIFMFKNKKPIIVYITYFVSVLCAIIILLVVKRGAIIGTAGAFIVLLYYLKDQRKKALGRIILFTLLLYLTFPLYENILRERVEARTTEDNYLEEESRYTETQIVLDEFLNKSLKHSLFGTECFNSPEYFGKFFKYNRQLHIDYMVLLHGSGIIGLILFLWIYYLMFKKMKSFSQLATNNKNDPEEIALINHIKALFIGLIVASLLVSISGGLAYYSLRALYLLYLGASLGFIKSLINQNAITYENNIYT